MPTIGDRIHGLAAYGRLAAMAKLILTTLCRPQPAVHFLNCRGSMPPCLNGWPKPQSPSGNFVMDCKVFVA
jgi:hypothetical protein